VATFVFVHGAWHGAWCWQPLIRELDERGHPSIAVNLPCDDVTAGLDAYARVVVEAMGDTPADQAVLVGHSLGGLTIPVVASRRPVARTVFLCGLVPRPGRPFSDDYGDPDLFVPGPSERTTRDELDRSYWPEPEAAIAALYADCDPADALEAVSRLRPQARRPTNDPIPIDGWPDAPSSSIVCDEDMMLSPAWVRRVTRERLGIEPIEMAGSHSPMLSRPGELADVLARLATSPD